MKSSQMLLLLISLLLALATVVKATSREPRRPAVVEANFIVVDTEPAETTLLAPQSSDSSPGTSALPPLMLLGFLTVIGAMLFHWSKDSSCQQERSVF